MKPIANFDADTQTVELDTENGPITLDMTQIEAIYDDALSRFDAAPVLEEPAGIYHPIRMDALPTEGALRFVMEFEDGSTGQFILPAPGKSEEQVAAASEVISQALLSCRRWNKALLFDWPVFGDG